MLERGPVGLIGVEYGGLATVGERRRMVGLGKYIDEYLNSTSTDLIRDEDRRPAVVLSSSSLAR